MSGDDKKRFCAQCKLHVHDLSAMTGNEAMAFLRNAGEGRTCVRFHRRADGRVLTRDCPVGLRRRLRQAWLRAAALIAALWTGTACTRTGAVAGNGSGAAVPRATMGEAVMGDVAAPPAAQQGQPAPVQPPAPVEVLQGKVRLPQQPPKK